MQGQSAEERRRARALGGVPDAMRALVAQLTPVIQARVARCLVRHGSPESRRNLQEEVADLTQEVFASLFEADGRALRRWRGDIGLSLSGFVGMIASRRAISILRPSRRSPWAEEPAEHLDALLVASDTPEALVASREVIGQVVAAMERELSPLGWSLFQRLLFEEENIADVATQSGMKRSTLYMWRCRLLKKVRQKAAELMCIPSPLPSGEEP